MEERNEEENRGDEQRPYPGEEYEGDYEGSAGEGDDEGESDELFERYRIKTDPKQTLIRLDKFLVDRLPNVTRNKVQEGIRNDFILVNNLPTKSNYKVRPNDVITVFLPQPARDTVVVPENIPLDILHEDDDLLVVNKPAGMVVHPAYNNWTGTLVNGLTYHFQNLPVMKNNEGRPGLVHRIDKDTSGLLVVAKSERAMSGLAEQFFNHSIERTYYALVWGEPKEEKGTIDTNLGRSPKDRRIVIAYPEGEYGRHAVTHYEVIKYFRYVSLIKCNLETGRTHQIRAHMAHLGHPLFNDTNYGGDRILKGEQFSKYKAFVQNCFKLMPRQALHAKSLGFVHPGTKEWVQFESKLPEDFENVIEKWDRYVSFTD
ncbi:RluA family pseudouridine synthase [Roseivirga sp. BDSF3-8]|uniref:RluA family pseudouridine synthase n=1 Tax=Roseivirga sp. BDSF3-8 TaxID=3241598 RepID=UPI003532058D